METKEKLENKLVKSEVENYADFNIIRYSQVWEDTETLLQALDIQEEDNILSIASAGENVLSMLIKKPKKIYAIDSNENQIICTEFKLICYKYLEYEECMQLLGVFECKDRTRIYKKIEQYLSENSRKYFNNNMEIIENGIIHAGKLEHYFSFFGMIILPLIHSKKTRKELLKSKIKQQRVKFYNEKWNNLRWKAAFRILFSKKVMEKLGKDEVFFRYLNEEGKEHILERTKYAFTELDPSQNSYLQYIVNGGYDEMLPLAYRKEYFHIIKNNIDKVVLLKENIETFIERDDIDYINKYNLSDIFEYISEEQMCKIVGKMLAKAPAGSKIAYWNILSDRRASKFIDKLEYKEEESNELSRKDKAFFYSKFILEEVKE